MFDNNIVLVLVVACLEIHQILMKNKNIASAQPALKATTVVSEAKGLNLPGSCASVFSGRSGKKF